MTLKILGVSRSPPSMTKALFVSLKPVGKNGKTRALKVRRLPRLGYLAPCHQNASQTLLMAKSAIIHWPAKPLFPREPLEAAYTSAQVALTGAEKYQTVLFNKYSRFAGRQGITHQKTNMAGIVFIITPLLPPNICAIKVPLKLRFRCRFSPWKWHTSDFL